MNGTLTRRYNFERSPTQLLNFGASTYLNPAMRRAYNAFRGRFRRATGKRRAGGRAQSYTNVKRKRMTSNTGILGGTNADTRMIYRKKRMPRKKRRRWASFVKKVGAVEERGLGTRTVLFNDQISQINNGASTQQSTLTLGLYGFVNSSYGWLNDMNQIGQLENEANPTAAAGATIDKNSKVIFTSSIMDVTLRNVSTFREGAVDKLASDAALELDIYEVYLRKEAGDIDGPGAFGNLTDMLSRYDEPQIGGTGVELAIGDRGVSPFELGSALGRCGIKIMKKTKFFIPNGQTITWQCRDPKRHVCRYGELEKQDGWVRPGWTRTYFLIYKLVPGLLMGAADGTYKAAISVGITRKYAYKVEGFNEPREKLLGASYVPSANA